MGYSNKPIKLLIVLLLFIASGLSASAPQLTNHGTYTTGLLSTNGSDTLTLANIPLAGDSLGLLLDFGSDSVSGTIMYRFISPSGRSNVSMSEATTLTSFDLNANQYVVFSSKLNRIAGAYNAQYFVIITNNKISDSPRIITTNVYSVIWR